MKPFRESSIRVIFGGVLWGVSGLLTVSLFLTLAGGDPLRLAVALAWAVGLEGAKILTWRQGGGWRVLALLLVCVTIFSAFGMALGSLDRTEAASGEAVVGRVRTSVLYANTSADLAEARTYKASLVARLATLPPDYTSAAATITSAISAQTATIQQLSTKLASLEQAPGAAPGKLTMFDALAGSGARTLEIGVAMVLAVLTEASALALSGKAKDIVGSGAKSDPAPDPAGVPADPTSVPDDPDGPELTIEDYMSEALRGRTDNRVHGRAVVAKRLGISERQARKLYDQLVTLGRIAPGQIKKRMD